MVHHGTSLRAETNQDFVYFLLRNFEEVTDKKDQAMLKYAIKLTTSPSDLSQDDIDILKEYNFSERDIFDINQVTAYFNYVNRIASGLGVELESDYI